MNSLLESLLNCWAIKHPALRIRATQSILSRTEEFVARVCFDDIKGYSIIVIYLFNDARASSSIDSTCFDVSLKDPELSNIIEEALNANYYGKSANKIT